MHEVHCGVHFWGLITHFQLPVDSTLICRGVVVSKQNPEMCEKLEVKGSHEVLRAYASLSELTNFV